MEVRFLDVAQQEFDETVEYNNTVLQGLGDQFLAEVLSSLEHIKRLQNRERERPDPTFNLQTQFRQQKDL